MAAGAGLEPSISSLKGMCPDLYTNRPFEMVPEVGLEPTRLSATDFESAASTIPPLGHSGGQDRIRTCDLRLRRATLYPAELLDQFDNL